MSNRNAVQPMNLKSIVGIYERVGDTHNKVDIGGKSTSIPPDKQIEESTLKEMFGQEIA